MLKELTNGKYFIYQLKDGGFGIVYADTVDDAFDKIINSYSIHGGGECNDNDIELFAIENRPYFEDTPDVFELGWWYGYDDDCCD